jgi:hypothetical protein
MRFEEKVIEGGPVVLPGTLALLEQVCAVASKTNACWKHLSD